MDGLGEFDAFLLEASLSRQGDLRPGPFEPGDQVDAYGDEIHDERPGRRHLVLARRDVYASLWNYRAFAERDFNRVDHRTVAMSVAEHPNYTDELVNGVAFIINPLYGFGDGYYVNSRVCEALVTNPEAESVPEEILLRADGTYTILATSNWGLPGNC